MTRRIVITLLLLCILGYVVVALAGLPGTENVLEVFTSSGRSGSPKYHGKVLLYGFTGNSAVMEALRAHGFEVVEGGANVSLNDVSGAVAIVINAHELFTEKTLNKMEIEPAMRAALMQGKPVAFVSEKGIDTQGLESLLKNVLRDRPITLKNVLTDLGEKSYEIHYDSSGVAISNRTVQEVCYVFILKLLGEKRTGVSTYGLCSSGSGTPNTPTTIYEYLATYLERRR